MASVPKSGLIESTHWSETDSLLFIVDERAEAQQVQAAPKSFGCYSHTGPWISGPWQRRCQFCRTCRDSPLTLAVHTLNNLALCPSNTPGSMRRKEKGMWFLHSKASVQRRWQRLLLHARAFLPDIGQGKGFWQVLQGTAESRRASEGKYGRTTGPTGRRSNRRHLPEMGRCPGARRSWAQSAEWHNGEGEAWRVREHHSEELGKSRDGTFILCRGSWHTRLTNHGDRGRLQQTDDQTVEMNVTSTRRKQGRRWPYCT